MRFPLHKDKKEEEFRKLYEEYYAPFCLYARRFITDAQLREDIVSEVFATLWSKRNELELNPGSTLGYLKMCVRNSCLNYLKHLNYEIDYAEVCRSGTPVYAASPDAVYNLEELYELLYKALDKLPENYRKVFMKSFFEGRTHAEIAKELQVSVKSVDRYKLKTLAVLRQEMKDYLPLFLIFLTDSLH